MGKEGGEGTMMWVGGCVGATIQLPTARALKASAWTDALAAPICGTADTSRNAEVEITL